MKPPPPADGHRAPPSHVLRYLHAGRVTAVILSATTVKDAHRSRAPDIMIRIGSQCLCEGGPCFDTQISSVAVSRCCVAHLDGRAPSTASYPVRIFFFFRRGWADKKDAPLFMFNPRSSLNESPGSDSQGSGAMEWRRCVQFKWKTRGLKRTCSYTLVVASLLLAFKIH